MTGQRAFLDNAGWSDADLTRIASDASDRIYHRVRQKDGTRAVLMSAPVIATPVAARQFVAFRRVAGWLRGIGLAAPAELAADPERGFLLLEDLGTVSLSMLLEQDAPAARDAYRAAIAVSCRLAEAGTPDWLDRPDAQAMADMVDLTFSFLPGARMLSEDLRGRLAEALGDIGAAPVVALRDMHGDNLIWRPGQEGICRVGLLDFQDAVVLPDGYDVASLLDDPRRVVPAAWRDDLIRAHAIARKCRPAAMTRQVDLLSLQRNLRVLGIFRRLATEGGRPAYGRFIPRTRSLIWRSAGHPDLHHLRPAIRRLLEQTAQWEAEAA